MNGRKTKEIARLARLQVAEMMMSGAVQPPRSATGLRALERAAKQALKRRYKRVKSSLGTAAANSLISSLTPSASIVSSSPSETLSQLPEQS